MLSLSRQGFFLLPLLIVLPMFFGLTGALFAGPVADGMACILALLLVSRNFKHLTAIEKGVTPMFA
jgi:Na+-driven multidrug efflux pump